MRSSWVRAALVGAGSLVLVVGFSACKNSLDFGTGGKHPCDFPGTVCSLGGDGTGDGGDSLTATFINPRGVARDAAGNLYIADTGGNRIRRIDVNGKVTTIAGTGRRTADFVPGLLGTETTVPEPLSVVVGVDGAIFWNDGRACGIYRLDPATQRVSIVANGLGCGYNGSPVSPAIGSRFDFSRCSHLSIDSLGNLIVPDTDNLRIRYVNLSSNTVMAWGVSVPPYNQANIAGNGDSTPFADGVTANGSTAVYNVCSAVPGPDGKLYLAAYGHERVRVIDTANVITTVAGNGSVGFSGDNGPAGSAGFDHPESLAVDAQGHIFVVDQSQRIRLVNPSGQSVTWGGQTINTGFILTIAGGANVSGVTSDGGAALNQSFGFSGPEMEFAANGDLLVPDPGNHVIRQIDSVTGTMKVIGGFAPGGTADTFLLDPSGIARAPDGGLFVGSRNRYINHVAPDGSVTTIAGNGSLQATGDGGPATSSGVWPAGMAVDKDGSLYFADPVNHLVRRIDPDGTILTIAGSGGGGNGGDGSPAVNCNFDGPWGIALDGSSNLFVASSDRIRFVNRNSAIRVIAGVSVIPGNIETIAGGNGTGFSGDGGPALLAQLFLQEYYTDVPIGLALDGGQLYIAEEGGNRIRRVDLSTGIVDTVIGSGQDTDDGVGSPVGLGISGGYLYWTQGAGSYVKRMQLPWSAAEIVAGDGNDGYYGDGQTGTDVEFYGPEGLAIFPNGTIYVADGSHHVRKIQP